MNGERFILIFLITIFSLASPAIACRGWQFETVTLLNHLPATAQQEEIVARVEVIEPLPPSPTVQGFWFTHLVHVRVVEPVKGIANGADLIVNTRDTLCDQNFTEKTKGQRGYVAGRLQKQPDGSMHFTGRWKRDLASGGMVKDAD